MTLRKKCLICGSRKWRKNALGLVACNEGHVLQHYINESEEAEDVGTHILRKRTLKSSRKKKEKASRADPKLYHGDRARFHYYQCLQLLFRKQVMALTALWNLPREFETICRDLWVLHLNLLPSPPPAEPFHYARDQDGLQYEAEETGKRDGSRSRHENARHTRFRDTADIIPDGDSSSARDEVLASEISVLLEESSEVSSSDCGSSYDESRARSGIQTSFKSAFVSSADRPENTVALLVLACWVVRLPVVYMDFINAIESYSLPYLDHVRSFPLSLTRHLTKHAVQALSPHHAPKTLSLHRLTSRLANRFYNAFDIVIPELNVAPVLWRVVRECFDGTPMLYALAKRVGNVLSPRLSLYGSPTVSISSGKKRDADIRRYENAPPEISLVTAAIVVLKLVYGLDGRQRLPRSPSDAACAFPAVTEYLAAVREADHAKSCGGSHRFGSRVPVSVGDLDDTALDEYLDFCQRVLVDPTRDEHRIIDDYFLLANKTGARRGEPRRSRGQGLSSTRRNDAGMDILEPGEMYTIYDSKDVLGNIPSDLRMLIERSARWAGIECEVVSEVVERYERRLVRWWADR